ncbi:hypothetical protein MZD04_gp083 [Pseudomonas phage Psa21]|uniref:Uncharacterized protein n=1 Tax=Pseudomonas phage Psa21 TaxID=2530023 RepID=A0A481W4H2_9CAUD|nr:hypothetical protein MZD04_gp083 [Pseudomonas phage Psa21]QBJ02611.1 hypothetical protein PSA21_83 [Pseudomonas phage Psa21]
MTRLSIDLSDPNGHVTQYSFGHKRRPRGGHLDKLYQEMGAVRPSTAEIMLREAYLDDYGIRPPDHNKHPLDVVRMFDKEDTVEGGSVRSLMRKYIRYNVKEQWGLSYMEFMELPYDEAAFILEIGETDMLRRVDEQSRVKRGMDRDLRDLSRQQK